MRRVVLQFVTYTALALGAVTSLALFWSATEHLGEGDDAPEQADGTMGPDAAPSAPHPLGVRARRRPRVPPPTSGCNTYGLGSANDAGGCDCALHAFTDSGVCKCVAGFIQATTPNPAASMCIPTPSGVAVVNDYANGASADAAYCPPGYPVSPGCHFVDA